MRFFLSNALDLRNTFEGFVAFHAAAYAIDCIGGKNDNPVVVEAFKDHLEVTRVRVIRMDF